MAKTIADSGKKKRRGWPETGIRPAMGLRLYPDMERQLDAWIAKQDDTPSRPEAIRRLLAKVLRGK